MQICASSFHGLKMCMWLGFNPAVNFAHFSTLLTLSFFSFSRCDISFTEVGSIFSDRSVKSYFAQDNEESVGILCLQGQEGE